MPNFLITYHGPGAPASADAQEAMAAFMAWASSAGGAVHQPRRIAAGQHRDPAWVTA